MIKMKGAIKKIFSVIFATTLTLSTITPTVYATSEIHYPDSLGCVVVASSDIMFNVDNAEINGNLYSDKNITTKALQDINVNGFATARDTLDEKIKPSKENSRIYNPADFKDSIKRNTKYELSVDDDLLIESTRFDASKNLYVKGEAVFDEVILSNGGVITAQKSIKLNPIQEDTDSDYYVVYSENGDITINGSSLKLNGIIYAPNGDVIFNVKELEIDGGVYARNITFNGTSLKINEDENAKNLVIDKLTVDAGEDREVYIRDSISLMAESNYDSASFVWSADESVEFSAPNSASTDVTFTKAGTYTLKVNATKENLYASDSLTVVVKPDPVKTYTSDEDFNAGEKNSVESKNDSLILSKSDNIEVNPITKNYEVNGLSGVEVYSEIEKDKITSQSEEFGVNYKLTAKGSDVSENSGVDFVFAIDNSGSMYGSYLTNSQEAARTILSYMHEGDRYAIIDLGKIHTGFTDDVDVINKEIDNIRSGSGSSEYGEGLKIANELFDKYSSENRQKCVMLLTDGENFRDIAYTDNISKECAERNVRVYSLAMNGERENMQNTAIITKGIYKFCPDADAIKKFMEKLGDRIFNSSVRNVVFKSTVADYNMIDFENITPAPSSVTKNDDGTAQLVWNFGSMDIDEINNIKLPVKYNLFPESGYVSISYDNAIYYNDKDGIGHKYYLEDVILPCVSYEKSGTWEDVYDSGKTGCEWTGISWNGDYPSDSFAKIYLSASDDGENFSEKVKVKNYQSLTGIKGRYVKTTVEFTRGTDGSTPVIDDIMVVSGEAKLSKPIDSRLSAKAEGSTNLNVNKTATFTAKINGSVSETKNIEWIVTGTEDYTLDTENPLIAKFLFKESGNYSITLKVTSGDDVAEHNFNVVVNEEEKVADIIEESSQTAVVKYTVEGLELHKSDDGSIKAYVNSRSVNLKLVTENPSSIAWVCARYYYFNTSNINLISVSEDYDMSFNYYSTVDSTIEITAYDWNGNPHTTLINVFFDRFAPTVNINKAENKSYYYTGDEYTVNVVAEDENKVVSLEFFVDDEPQQLDENNSYTFVPDEDRNYVFKAIATDISGNSTTKTLSQRFYNDTTPPTISPSNLNKYSACIGNEIILTAGAYDNQTGIKSFECKLNGEKIELNENNQYSFVPTEAGVYEFVLTAVDNRDNTTTRTLTVNVTEDRQRPSVTIKSDINSNMLVNKTATFTVTASDNVAIDRIDVDVNEKKYQLDENNQFKFKPTEAGKYKVTAIVYDTVGNSATTYYNFTVFDEDTVNPTVSISVNKSYEYNQTSYKINFTSNDNIKVSKRRLYIDGKRVEAENISNSYSYSYTDSYTFVPVDMGVGEHKVKAVVEDGSGNKAEAEKIFTIADTVAPTINLSGTGTINMDTDLKLDISITDFSDIAEIKGYVNDDEIELTNELTQSYVINKPKAGTYLFSITAKDVYGNNRTATKTITVRDTEKPAILVSDVQAEYYYPEKPEIKMTVTDNIGVESVSVTMNKQTLEYDGEKIILPDELPIGDYKINVTAKDSSGNTETKEIVFSIVNKPDTTAPELKSLSVEPDYVEVGTEIRVSVTAEDDSGTAYIKVFTDDDEKFEYKDGVFVFKPTKTGNIVVNILIYDASGNNVVYTASGYVNPDTTAPTIKIDGFETMRTGEKQTIEVSATDNNEVKSVSLTLNEKSVALVNGKYEFTPDKAGTYTFTAYAEDSFGNKSHKNFVVVVSSEENEPILEEYKINSNETEVTESLTSFVEQYDTPIKVYNFAKNNLMPEFYQGIRKGAGATLEQHGGNDLDTASFLVAVLRMQGYASRYVSGTVEYSQNEILALTGAETVESARDTILSSGYDCQVYRNSKGEMIIRMPHTWVEAYLPLNMCGESSESMTWVTLDAWYKKCQLNSGVVENKNKNVELNANEEFAKSLQSSFEELEQELGVNETSQNFKSLVNSLINDSRSDVSYKLKLITESEITSLPKSPEFKIVSKGTAFDKADAKDIDTISFTVDGKQLAELKTYNLSAKNVLLEYVPSTEADKEIFAQKNCNWKNVGTSINASATITVDGKQFGTASGVRVGTSQTLKITVKSNGQTKTYNDNIMAGNMYSITSNLYDISEYDLKKAYEVMSNYASTDEPYGAYSEELLGSLLNFAGKYYYSLSDRYEESFGAEFNVNQTSEISVGLFGYEFGTKENFYGNVTGLKDGSFMTDIDENKSTVVSRRGNDEDRKNFILNSGIMQSYLEGYIWGMITDSYGLSTMSVLAYSSIEGVDILTITPENMSDVYKTNQSDVVIQDIRNYVEQGYTAIVPAKQVTIQDWTGTGYILASPNYDNNIFRLSNTINGGGEGLIISLDDVMFKNPTGIYNGWTGDKNEDGTPAESKQPYDSDDKYNLRDGNYSIDGVILKTDKLTRVKADEALEHQNIRIRVIDGVYYLYLDFNAITDNGMTGYMNKLEYYKSGYSLSGTGEITGELANTIVLTNQRDSENAIISDKYGTNYPDKLCFELIPEALRDGYVPLQITANVMNDIAPQYSIQSVFLKLDWSSRRFIPKGSDPYDPDAGTSGTGGNGSGSQGDGSGGGSGSGDGDPSREYEDEYYGMSIDLEKLMNQVYRIRVMLATTKLANATINMASSAYGKNFNPTSFERISGILGSAKEASIATNMLFDARKMLLDFYFEADYDKQMDRVMAMMTICQEEIDAFLNGFIPSKMQNAINKASDYINDKIIDSLPNGVKNVYDEYARIKELFKVIGSLNESLKELSKESD